MMFMFPASFAFFLACCWGVYLSVCSGDFLFLWLAMELGSLGFIGFMSTNRPSFCSESLAKYYLPNSAANLFFVMLILWYVGGGNNVIFAWLAIFPMLVKLGIPPFHFWLPNTVRNLSWLEVFVLLGVNKFGPIHALTWSAPMTPEFVIWGVVTAYWGAVGGMNQCRFNKMVSYSSVNLMGWILSVSAVDYWVPYVSWALYSLTLLGLMSSANNDQQIIVGRNPALAMFLVMMGGWPAGSIFTLKWLSLTSLLVHSAHLPSLLLALSSAFAAPMYLNFIFCGYMHPSVRVELVFTPPKWLAFWLASSYFWVPCYCPM